MRLLAKRRQSVANLTNINSNDFALESGRRVFYDAEKDRRTPDQVKNSSRMGCKHSISECMADHKEVEKNKPTKDPNRKSLPAVGNFSYLYSGV